MPFRRRLLYSITQLSTRHGIWNEPSSREEIAPVGPILLVYMMLASLPRRRGSEHDSVRQSAQRIDEDPGVLGFDVLGDFDGDR